MIIQRRMKMNGEGWKDLPPVETAHVRSLDQGLLKDRILITGESKENSEFYRTMLVNSSYIFSNGNTQYIGFVSDDYAEDYYVFHVEEWIVEQ